MLRVNRKRVRRLYRLAALAGADARATTETYRPWIVGRPRWRAARASVEYGLRRPRRPDRRPAIPRLDGARSVESLSPVSESPLACPDEASGKPWTVSSRPSGATLDHSRSGHGVSISWAIEAWAHAHGGQLDLTRPNGTSFNPAISHLRTSSWRFARGSFPIWRRT